MPVTTGSTTCKGYILTPPTSEGQQDPYALMPCPHTPTTPLALSKGCAQSRRKKACGKGVWCEMHHCGGCKKAVKEGEHNGEGKNGK
jgi:hypothetical protein